MLFKVYLSLATAFTTLYSSGAFIPLLPSRVPSKILVPPNKFSALEFLSKKRSVYSFSHYQPLFSISSVPESSAEQIKLNIVKLWSNSVSSDEMMVIRSELINKYLEHGLPISHAENEVDAFLSDKEKSKKYIEMRLMCTQSESLPVTIIQMCTAFVVGLCMGMPQEASGFLDLQRYAINL